PEKPYADKKFVAQDVKVGAFALSPSQVERLPTDENLTVTPEMLAALSDDLKPRAKVDSEGRLFVAAEAGGTPDAPRIGDARIRYKVAKPQTISLTAKQMQNSFVPYQADAGE